MYILTSTERWHVCAIPGVKPSNATIFIRQCALFYTCSRYQALFPRERDPVPTVSIKLINLIPHG